MKDDNVYIKNDNGHYIPYGRRFDEQYLPDGIWYVRHKKYSHATTNMDHLKSLFRIGQAIHPSLHELAGLEDYADYILSSDDCHEMLKNGASMSDLIHLVLAKVFEYNHKCALKDEKLSF